MNFLTNLWSASIPAALLIVLVFWDLIWRGIALWKSARNGHKYWFIALLIINSVGILPIIYIVFFSKPKNKAQKAK